jgi:hypothetical protein
MSARGESLATNDGPMILLRQPDRLIFLTQPSGDLVRRAPASQRRPLGSTASKGSGRSDIRMTSESGRGERQ